MNILAIDTTDKLLNIAIGTEKKVIQKYKSDEPNIHSGKLIPFIDNVLKQSRLKINDINLICAASGPGSFTGIRIGLSAVKAICYSLKIPCLGISSLDILARGIKTNHEICAAINARNNNVYYCKYKYIENILTKITDYDIIDSAELLKTCNENTVQAGFLGNTEIDPENIIKLGVERFSEAGENSWLTLKPLYLNSYGI